MYDRGMSKAELLAVWRDAVRASELAERLAAIAADAAAQADLRSGVSAEIADLAEQAAESATRAAARAREAATHAAELAKSLHDDGVPAADKTLESARQIESDARTAYRTNEVPTATEG
jgi:hypothetical protein